MKVTQVNPKKKEEKYQTITRRYQKYFFLNHLHTHTDKITHTHKQIYFQTKARTNIISIICKIK